MVEADNVGAPYDRVALQRDGTLVVQQVKYATAPESEDDRLTWDLLLEQPSGKSGARQSLLKKWSASLISLAVGSPSIDASLVTNRRPAPEFAQQLTTDD